MLVVECDGEVVEVLGDVRSGFVAELVEQVAAKDVRSRQTSLAWWRCAALTGRALSSAAQVRA